MKLIIASLAALSIVAPAVAQNAQPTSQSTTTSTTTTPDTTTTKHKVVRHHKPVKHRKHKVVRHKHKTHSKATIKSSSSTQS